MSRRKSTETTKGGRRARGKNAPVTESVAGADAPAADAKPNKAARRGKETPHQTVPAVNLLSPWTLDEIRTHQLRRKFVLGAVGLVVVVGLAFGGQTWRTMMTNADLEAAEAETVELNAQINELTPVANYVADVADRGALIGESMRTEIAFSTVADNIRDLAPGSVSFDSVSATIPGPDQEQTGDPDSATRGLSTSCGGPDPFAVREVVGCVSLSGTAGDRDAVGDLVDALDAAGLFVEPFVTSTTADPGGPVAFSGSVGISPDAFSGRYDELSGDVEKSEDENEEQS